MKIDIVCSSSKHPVNEYLNDFSDLNKDDHQVQILRKASELRGGDVLFLVSCQELIDDTTRTQYRYALVLHASNLPEGRGWSPHIWQLLEGRSIIYVTILEAKAELDSGRICGQKCIEISKTALYDEINHQIFSSEIALMQSFVDHSSEHSFNCQRSDVLPSYYRKRTPSDSQIDTEKSILEQFNLLRICDPDRYPAYFEIYGQKYKIRIEKISDESSD